ncbi:hypothetical protein [Membranihabitans marinus]|uniref:hypothetical protein n=1 Tax=Membranihabitans marinus TaxID=1227546 RepID=UPI001F25FAC2|nr:hypothetical protein [Membranihabitans marinus]
MKYATQYYIKFFILTAVSYFIISWLFDIVLANEINFLVLMISSIVFGILLSLILGFVYQSDIKSLSMKDPVAAELSANQGLRISSHYNLMTLKEKLQSNPLTQSMKIIDNENEIQLKVKSTWKSWGEKIKIDLLTQSDEGYLYRLTNNSKWYSMVNFNKNYKNFLLLKDILSA